ncbi:hypothetical protein HanIR_Chr10g0474741 [Helianthus annuus]|nr:hypothetical protein HanIR_Chr10g0474741 [Helianthus annuus]
MFEGELKSDRWLEWSSSPSLFFGSQPSDLVVTVTPRSGRAKHGGHKLRWCVQVLRRSSGYPLLGKHRGNSPERFAGSPEMREREAGTVYIFVFIIF